jgi:hypothetical protein
MQHQNIDRNFLRQRNDTKYEVTTSSSHGHCSRHSDALVCWHKKLCENSNQTQTTYLCQIIFSSFLSAFHSCLEHSNRDITACVALSPFEPFHNILLVQLCPVHATTYGQNNAFKPSNTHIQSDNLSYPQISSTSSFCGCRATCRKVTNIMTIQITR